MDWRGIWTNGPKCKNVDDYAQSFTSEKWQRQTPCVKKERGRGPSSVKNCVVTSTQGPEDYIKKGKERLIAAANKGICKTITDRKTTKTRKQKWKKTTVWIFQATNKRDCTIEDLDMAPQRKSKARN